MSVRVAINGFGRVGRRVLRAAVERDLVEIVHVNEAGGGAAAAAHLLASDGTRGRWQVPVSCEAGALLVAGRRIGFSTFAAPSDMPWSDLGIDVVIEASGRFVTAGENAGHFERGARKVVVAAPVKAGALNLVVGINDHLYDPDRHHLVTAASCTANCLVPVIKVIHDSVGIRHGAVTMLHDGSHCSASDAVIGMIYPELAGRLDGIAVRVPSLDAPLADTVFEVARETSAAEVATLFAAAAEGPLHGVLGYEDRSPVPAGYADDPRSAIVDGPSILVVGGTSVKVLVRYDNETGYAHRLAELAAKVSASLHAR
jgi:glyceraldehyde 3-phosphate dehydrogenase